MIDNIGMTAMRRCQSRAAAGAGLTDEDGRGGYTLHIIDGIYPGGHCTECGANRPHDEFDPRDRSGAECRLGHRLTDAEWKALSQSYRWAAIADAAYDHCTVAMLEAIQMQDMAAREHAETCGCNNPDGIHEASCGGPWPPRNPGEECPR